jgi:3-oxoacyl-[acyl-carrier protein] reductase
VSTLAFPNAAVYSGPKGAVDAITRSLAAELGPRKIRVNAILGGNASGAISSGIPCVALAVGKPRWPYSV